jgi:hypothetical protein
MKETRKLPVVIGSFEAQAIAVGYGAIMNPKPAIDKTMIYSSNAMDTFDIESSRS